MQNDSHYVNYFGTDAFIGVSRLSLVCTDQSHVFSIPRMGAVARARLEARKFMNEETARTAEEHSFCNVCFPERQNELFGDIRTSVGGSLLRGIASAASELVSHELDVRCVFARYRNANLYQYAPL